MLESFGLVEELHPIKEPRHHLAALVLFLKHGLPSYKHLSEFLLLKVVNDLLVASS